MWSFLFNTSQLIPVPPYLEEEIYPPAKMVRQVPTAGQAELFLKLRGAMTHPSYSLLTSRSSH